MTPAELIARYSGAPDENGCILWMGSRTKQGRES